MHSVGYCLLETTYRILSGKQGGYCRVTSGNLPLMFFYFLVRPSDGNEESHLMWSKGRDNGKIQARRQLATNAKTVLQRPKSGAYYLEIDSRQTLKLNSKGQSER